MTRRRAAFLDRDGTIIQDVNFLTRVEDIRLLPRSVEGLRYLRAHGYLLILVSNQSAVARGMITEEEMWQIHRQFESLLREAGVRLDGAYYCPHHPEGCVPRFTRECECRKPRPGMILRAATEHGIDLQHSVMIGDGARDVEAGKRAGCRAIWLRHDRPIPAEPQPDLIASDLLEAAERMAGVTSSAEDRLRTIRERCPENRISCRDAFALAEELNMSRAEFGKLLDQLGIRLKGCQFGCF